MSEFFADGNGWKMTKTDQILDYVIEMKTDVGSIKQHLKTINGTICSHNKKINELTKRQYWAFGVGAGILFAIGLIFKFL